MLRRFAHLSTVVSRTTLQSSEPTVLKQVNAFSSNAPKKKIYIVLLRQKKYDDPELVTASHHEMLTPLFKSKKEAVRSIVHSFNRAWSGFAAKLTESQADILADRPDVFSVRANRIIPLRDCIYGSTKLKVPGYDSDEES